MRYRIHFDGACTPRNPGGIATSAFIVDRREDAGTNDHGTYSEVHRAWQEVKRGDGATNNFAEWCGIGLALKWFVDSNTPIEELEIIGDSQLVINQLLGKWECHDAMMMRLRTRCMEHLEVLKSRGLKKRSARWVRREHNAECDELTKRAYQEAIRNA